MNTMKRVALASIAGSALALASSAHANDRKDYIGSQCSFADFPLASHNKIHHLFTNTSGSGQWITCPVVRDTDNNLEWAGIETSNVVSNARLELRNMSAGTLVGWDTFGTTALGGTNLLYNWFTGSATGPAPSGGVLAFEMFLPNNVSIYRYVVDEL